MASSVVTGGVGMAATTLAPLVSWLLNGCPKPIPDSVPVLISAVLIWAVHLFYNIYASRQVRPQPEVPSLIEEAVK